MQLKTWISLLLLGVLMGGCDWMGDRWPWRRQDVPMTEPTAGDEEAMAADTTAEPATSASGGHGPIRPVDAAAVSPSTANDPGPMAVEDLALEPDPAEARRDTGREVGDAVASPTGLPDDGPAHVEPVVVLPPRRRPSPAKTAPETTADDLGTQSARQPSPPAKSLPRATRPVPQQPAYDEPAIGESRVVAASLIQVNDRFITIEDILRGAAGRLDALPQGLPEPAFRRRVFEVIQEEMRRQVVELLSYEEANRRLTEDQQALVEQQVEERRREMIAQSGGSERQLERTLAQRGTDLETVLEGERRRITVQGWMQGRLYPQINLSRKELWDYYTEHQQDEFTRDRKVQMQVIAAPFRRFLPEGDRASRTERAAAAKRARETIHAAAAALRAGDDFGDVARKYSKGIKAGDGGLWPMMAAGNFRQEEVEAAAFAMSEGEVSDVIETPDGYYIVKAHRVDPGRVIGFLEAQEQIQQRLREARFQRLQSEHFRGLIDRAHIEESEEFLQLAVDRAVKRYRDR